MFDAAPQAAALNSAPALRLNLGAGVAPLDGWVNVDRADGGEVFPLSSYPDGSVAEIRASHVLEHFSFRLTHAVLSEWVRVLQPGGLLRVAVPDFEAVARAYLSGAKLPIEGYVMGGHADDNDRHGAIFDAEQLGDAMRRAGLFGMTRWQSEQQDCAAYPISLNLQGWKRPAAWPKVGACMSVPRLGFMDNFFAAFEALQPLGITLRKQTGAFWGQCITRAIEMILDQENPEYILTVDYDSVYSRNDVEALLSAALRHPEIDAIAPVQASRTLGTPLMTLRGADGKNAGIVDRNTFEPELVPAATAHFGLTLIKASALRAMPKPWFLGVPCDDGTWGPKRVDDDIHFWKQFERGGFKLAIASRVPIGHAELMVRWPDRNMAAMYQHPSEYWATGKPDEVWR